MKIRKFYYYNTFLSEYKKYDWSVTAVEQKSGGLETGSAATLLLFAARYESILGFDVI